MFAMFAATTVQLPSKAFAAPGWIESVLIGPLGTGLAVVAVALVGLSALSGRISMRRCGMVVAGCFILFGAPELAESLLGLASLSHSEMAPVVMANDPPPIAPPPAYDPYAGAAVPTGQ